MDLLAEGDKAPKEINFWRGTAMSPLYGKWMRLLPSANPSKNAENFLVPLVVLYSSGKHLLTFLMLCNCSL